MKFKYAQEISNLPDGEHFDANTPGLSLIKRKTGKHSWTLLYRFNSPKLKRWTIGRLDRISLKEARKRVRTRSDDPVADKKKQRLEENNTPTFKQLCKRYIKEWCEKNQRYWKKSETALKHPRYDSWQRRRVIEIERSDVKKLIATIPGNGLANQVRSLLHGLFNFALDEDILLVNPVTRTKKRSAPSRDRVLTDDEIRSVWKITLFRLLLLTCQRPDNVKKICRSEINGKEWTVPASKFKLKRVHVVPLVPTAIETLAELPKRGDRYFAPHECLGLIALLDKIGVPSAKPKDLQRTVRTRLAMLNVWPDTASRIHGHVLPGIRGTYDRHDYFSQKYDALVKWETELGRIIDGETRRVIKFSEAT